jgi:integrase
MRLYPRGKAGVWWCDFGEVGGQRARRSSGTTDRAAAQEWAAATAASLWRTQRLGEPARVLWDEAVVAWVADHEHLRSIEDTRRILRWWSDRLQGHPLADITDSRIRALTLERRRQVIPGGRATSAATSNRHLAHLSAVLHYAHRRGWLAAVPPIAKAHEPAKRIVWITHEQAEQLLRELPAHLAAMAAFALATGLRESNVRLLTWQQVDTARSLAWIHADQAKAGKDMSIPLNVAALEVLRRQAGQHRRWVFPVPRWTTYAAGRAHQVADSPTGKISSQAWRKACIRAGLPTLRFHDLRHTWASWHVQAGTPLAVLQELGGWASLAMVQRYAHLGATHVAAWAANIGATGGAGTNLAHGTAGTGSKTGPAGPAHEVKQVGWLMGLEPTTTGITIGSTPAKPSKIKDLAAARRRKAA